MLLKPLPSIPDYREVGRYINGRESIERVIFKYPADMVVTMFYLDTPDISHFIHNSYGEYESWAVLDKERGMKEVEVIKGDLLLIQLWERDEYIKRSFTVVFESRDFVLIEKI